MVLFSGFWPPPPPKKKKAFNSFTSPMLSVWTALVEAYLLERAGVSCLAVCLSKHKRKNCFTRNGSFFGGLVAETVVLFLSFPCSQYASNIFLPYSWMYLAIKADWLFQAHSSLITQNGFWLLAWKCNVKFLSWIIVIISFLLKCYFLLWNYAHILISFFFAC